jgi:hypothetical protein
MGGDEYYKDVQEEITGGITNLEKFLKGKKGFAAGGRVGMFRGGVPKGLQAAFARLAKGKNKQMTDDEYTDFVDEIGGADRLEAYTFDGTIKDAQRILTEDKAYTDEMFAQYKAGKLDPEPGEVSRGRLQKLQEKLEEMEMTGDKRLMTPDEMEELMFLEKKFAKEALDAKAQGTRKMSNEEIAELKALSDMGYKDGGDVSLTVIKIPDISESGVESLFKRR